MLNELNAAKQFLLKYFELETEILLHIPSLSKYLNLIFFKRYILSDLLNNMKTIDALQLKIN
jgi:hypothetical protein